MASSSWHIQHATVAMQTRLFVTLTRYWSGVTKAKNLSMLSRSTWPALTLINVEKNFKGSNAGLLLWNTAQPQYAVRGHATKPIRRSAIDMERMIKFEGDDRSFFRGSFQTDTTTYEFPDTMIRDMIIARTATVVDMVFTLSTLSHTFSKASSLVIFQKSKLPVMAAIFVSENSPGGRSVLICDIPLCLTLVSR